MSNSQSVIVSEISMQEWAMVAFKAERAPRRVTIRTSEITQEANSAAERGIGGARTIFWLLLAAAMSTTLLFV